MNRHRLQQLFDTLFDCHGQQGWWPADSDIEMSFGAILVQNTNWTNARLAIEQLRKESLLNQLALLECPQDRLETHIRSSGYFRQKAARLRIFCRWLVDHGGFESLRRRSTSDLRESLLGLSGIGPETADCILLYAFERPVFVADGYARRILERLGLTNGSKASAYEKIRRLVEEEIRMDAGAFKEFHALLVTHGKKVCGPKPDCKVCDLSGVCRFHHDKVRLAGATERRN
jgi:endonuclease-3 related protein